MNIQREGPGHVKLIGAQLSAKLAARRLESVSFETSNLVIFSNQHILRHKLVKGLEVGVLLAFVM